MSVYAITDLHGNYEIWKQIKNFLKPEDTLYVLGDCADRGAHGWEIIKDCLTNEQVVYLRGNHEDMLQKAMEEYYEDNFSFYDYTSLLLYNGGESTYRSWINEDAHYEWAIKLKKLTHHCVYTNKNGIDVILTHAGYTPPNVPKDVKEFIWSRNHFNDNWNYKDNAIVVHGHTPITHIRVPEVKTYKEGALWYCNNHKVCLDTSCWRTNHCVMLDLDTFDEHIFVLEKEKKNEN